MSTTPIKKKNMYKSCSANRIVMAFAFCLGFGWVGVCWATAQAAPREPANPLLPSTVVQQPSPEASPKLNAVRSVRPVATARPKAQKEPEQMKIVRVYQGEGYFDAALAEKLRPVLAKTFGVTPANQSAVTDLVRSMFGQNDGQKNKTNQNSNTNTGQP